MNNEMSYSNAVFFLQRVATAVYPGWGQYPHRISYNTLNYTGSVLR